MSQLKQREQIHLSPLFLSDSGPLWIGWCCLFGEGKAIFFFFFFLMETFFGPQPQNAEVPKPGEFPLWRSGNESDYYP